MKNETRWCAYDRIKKGYIKVADAQKGYHLTNNPLDALTWSERVSFKGLAEAYKRPATDWAWKAQPNRQRFRVTYDEKHPQHVTHDVTLPVDNPPHINENGWLEVGGVATNGHNIENIVITPIGSPYYDKTFGGGE